MSTSIVFPPYSAADADGFLAWSEFLDAEMLSQAYQRGIFPWPQEERHILWYCPPQRGLLFLKDFHLARSFLKWYRRDGAQFEIRKNSDFTQILEGCASQIRPGQQSTWITQKMRRAYEDLFARGEVICFGVYLHNELLAGVYAVRSQKYWSAESMFHKRSNLSKLAFWHLVQEAQAEGLSWIDLQMLTPISESFGGRYHQRRDFLGLLGIAE